MVQERLVGPDHQHAVAFEPVPLGVEQVGDAMQRDDGLSGSGATFDHQHSGVIEPDDLVLFGLDCRHDVAHPVTARRADRREQRRVATFAGTGTAQDLIGEIEHLTPASVELAAPPHVLRARRGGDIERARGRRPPIEQQRLVFVLLVENADPADVQMLVRNGVQPTETQPVVRHVEPLHRSGQRPHFGIAFHECPAHLQVDGAQQRRVVVTLQSRPLDVEPRVELGHVALFVP